MVHGNHHFPCAVTTMVTRRVRPGREASYEAWLREVSAVARTFPGHLGVVILGPHGAAPASYSAIFSFDTTDHLAAWMRSAERRDWLERARELTLDDGEVESLSGLEPWFVLPDRTVSQAPPRWKMALLTAVGVFPLLLVLKVATAPVLAGWPWPAALAVQLAIGIPLMTWVVMPKLSRWLFTWLYPEPAARRTPRVRSGSSSTAAELPGSSAAAPQP